MELFLQIGGETINAAYLAVNLAYLFAFLGQLGVFVITSGRVNELRGRGGNMRNPYASSSNASAGSSVSESANATDGGGNSRRQQQQFSSREQVEDPRDDANGGNTTVCGNNTNTDSIDKGVNSTNGGNTSNGGTVTKEGNNFKRANSIKGFLRIILTDASGNCPIRGNTTKGGNSNKGGDNTAKGGGNITKGGGNTNGGSKSPRRIHSPRHSPNSSTGGNLTRRRSFTLPRQLSLRRQPRGKLPTGVNISVVVHRQRLFAGMLFGFFLIAIDYTGIYAAKFDWVVLVGMTVAGLFGLMWTNYFIFQHCQSFSVAEFSKNLPMSAKRYRIALDAITSAFLIVWQSLTLATGGLMLYDGLSRLFIGVNAMLQGVVLILFVMSIWRRLTQSLAKTHPQTRDNRMKRVRRFRRFGVLTSVFLFATGVALTFSGVQALAYRELHLTDFPGFADRSQKVVFYLPPSRYVDGILSHLLAAVIQAAMWLPRGKVCDGARDTLKAPRAHNTSSVSSDVPAGADSRDATDPSKRTTRRIMTPRHAAAAAAVLRYSSFSDAGAGFVNPAHLTADLTAIAMHRYAKSPAAAGFVHPTPLTPSAVSPHTDTSVSVSAEAAREYRSYSNNSSVFSSPHGSVSRKGRSALGYLTAAEVERRSSFKFPAADVERRSSFKYTTADLERRSSFKYTTADVERQSSFKYPAADVERRSSFKYPGADLDTTRFSHSLPTPTSQLGVPPHISTDDRDRQFGVPPRIHTDDHDRSLTTHPHVPRYILTSVHRRMANLQGSLSGLFIPLSPSTGSTTQVAKGPRSPEALFDALTSSEPVKLSVPPSPISLSQAVSPKAVPSSADTTPSVIPSRTLLDTPGRNDSV